MDFTPKDEKDLKKFELLPADSIYDFEVLEATDRVSKSGNEMIEINLGLYITDKIGHRIYDYLLSQMEAKLRHFCDTTGLLREYENGTLTAAMCKGRAGKCKIGIKTDKNGEYADRNFVKDYICRPAKSLGGHTEYLSEEEAF